MDSELTGILKGIKQKTGIDIDAYAETMKFSATTRDKADWVLPPKMDFTDVYSDEKCNKTFFVFRFRNARLIGSITGVSEVERNYAYLIMSLLDSNSGKDERLGRGEQLKSIILGDYTRQQIQKFIRRYSIPDVKCYVLLIASLDGSTEKVIGYLARHLSNEYDSIILTEDMRVSLVKFVLEGVEPKPEQVARNIVAQLKENDLEVKVGVSAVVDNLLDVNNAYIQAANALRISDMLSSKESVHSYKDYLIVKILEEIPKFLLSEYLSILENDEAKYIFNDQDMVLTSEVFFENNLNVSETARQMFMHRNTLIYRLEKIEKQTGLDITKFSDAVTFKLITILRKLTNSR